MDCATLNLRPYQRDVLRDVETELAIHDESLLLLPTGAGKTEVALELLRRRREAFAGFTALIIMGSNDLKMQWVTRGSRLLGDMAVGLEVDRTHIRCCTVQSVGSARPKWAEWRSSQSSPDLIIVDEAHHALAQSYRRVVDAFPDAQLLGMTACPDLLSKKRCLAEVFNPDAVVQGIQTHDLVAGAVQYLSDIQVFAPAVVDRARFEANDPKERGAVGGDFKLRQGDSETLLRRGKVLEEYRNVAKTDGGWRPTIVFCGWNEGADDWADVLRGGGVRAAAYHSKIPAVERRAIRRAFDEGRLDALVTVAMFIEGIDAPHAEVLLGLRPTKSLNYYLQMCGRLLRLKKDADGNPIVKTYLDCVGNVSEHGHPFTRRVWDITECVTPCTAGTRPPPEHTSPKARRQADEMVEVHPPRVETFDCPGGCGASLPPFSLDCTACGWSREIEAKAEAWDRLLHSRDALTAADTQRECDRLLGEHRARIEAEGRRREAARRKAKAEAERRQREQAEKEEAARRKADAEAEKLRRAQADAEAERQRAFWEADTLPADLDIEKQPGEVESEWHIRITTAFQWAARKATTDAWLHLESRVGYSLGGAAKSPKRPDLVVVLMILRHAARHHFVREQHWWNDRQRLPKDSYRSLWRLADRLLLDDSEILIARAYVTALCNWKPYALKHQLADSDILLSDGDAERQMRTAFRELRRLSPKLVNDPWLGACPVDTRSAAAGAG